jgi:hypothetical protein
MKKGLTLLEEIIAKYPDSNLAQMPMNSFKYKLLMLLIDRNPTTVEDQIEVVADLAQQLAATCYAMSRGYAELAKVLLTSVYTIEMDHLTERGNYESRDS